MEINILYIGLVILIVLLSMTLHEAMHAFTSYWLGDDTAKMQGRLTLNPIAHIDPILTIALPVFLAIAGGPIFGGAKPVPFNPQRVRYGEIGAAMVGAAGPLTNLVIAFVLYGSLAIIDPGGVAASVLGLAIVVNLGFFIFNSLPIPPLDGSRVLYAIAPDFFRRGMELIEQYGIILVFAVVILFSSVIGTFIIGVMIAILEFFSVIFGGPGGSLFSLL